MQVQKLQKEHTDQLETPPQVPTMSFSQAAPPPLPSVAPPPPVVDYAAYTMLEGSALMFGSTILAGYNGPVTVIGGSENINLIGLGRGDLTLFAGSGVTIAHGGSGNNTFVGGDGVNKFFAGPNMNTFVQGEGYNEFHGSSGYSTFIFGQQDQVIGGRGPEHLMYSSKASYSDAGYGFIRNLDFVHGDTLDFTMQPDITRENMKVVDDELIIKTPDGTLDIYGAGVQIVGVYGSIAAAIAQGHIVTADYYDGGKG